MKGPFNSVRAPNYENLRSSYTEFVVWFPFRVSPQVEASLVEKQRVIP